VGKLLYFVVVDVASVVPTKKQEVYELGNAILRTTHANPRTEFVQVCGNAVCTVDCL
jgi:hypothetical protein